MHINGQGKSNFWRMVRVAAAFAVATCGVADASETLRDCPECPELVVVPAGEFWMGSRPRQGDSVEHPRHRVVIDEPLAVGRFEVTFAQWDACRRAGGCSHHPYDEGWGRGRYPVINVNWGDAREYVRWLSRKTGERYRLLSESEWEYVARGGTDSTRYWGHDPADACDYANVADSSLKANPPEWWSDSIVNWKFHPCRDGQTYTSPAGLFSPNGFGLYDMLGNVWEWVKDCWHEDYADAPEDGSAWIRGGDCEFRMLRGGSWGDDPEFVRSASRLGGATGARLNDIGFRVARTLD